MDQQTQHFMEKCTLISDNQALRMQICEMLSLRNNKFPGAQPVSLEPKRDLSIILTQNFHVCEKTDGTRFMFYANFSDYPIQEQDFVKIRNSSSATFKWVCYFIDREYHFHQLKCRIRAKAFFDEYKIESVTDLCKFKMLLDGEVVCDTEQVTGKKSLVFYLFDSLYIQSSTIFDNLTTRLEKAFKLVNLVEKVTNPAYETDKTGINSLTFKDKLFVNKTDIKAILKQQITLKHHSDGLVFTQSDAAYQFGTTNYILKWKPKDENTVDLCVRLHQEPAGVVQEKAGLTNYDHLSPNDFDHDKILYFVRFYVANKGIMLNQPIQLGGQVLIDKQDYDNLKKLKQRQNSNELIQECYWNEEKNVQIAVKVGDFEGKAIFRIVSQQGGWDAKKVRTDKKLPNDIRVYDSVVRAYDQFVSIDDLIQIIQGDKKAPGVCRRVNPFIRQKCGMLKTTCERFDDE